MICFYGETLEFIPKLYLLPLLIWSTVTLMFDLDLFYNIDREDTT